MSQELEPIIRKIEKRSLAKPGKAVVAVDRKSGKAISDRGFIGLARNLLQDVVLYEITVDERYWIENARAAIAVFLTNERSQLAFRMRVLAPRADAIAIAEALHDYELSPSEVLFKTVRTHLGALLEKASRQGPESVVERIASNRPAWQAEIERVIASRLHLDAEIIFEFQRPIIDTDVSVRADAIQVLPKDAPHATFPITVSIVLERTQARANDPLPRSEEERQRLVRDVVSKAFRDRISLFTYWFQPETLANELAAALSEVLLRYAYVLKSLTVDPIVPPVAAEEQIVDDVSWTGRLARPIPFHIESKVRMTPTGAGAYHGLKLPNRKDWIKTEVQAALKSAMHGRDFIDLTPEAEREVHNTVHQRLNERARTIGHEVDTFVASAAIPEKIWLDPVTVEVDRREYKTKNDLVPAEFEISLVVRMPTLARLEQVIQAHRLTRSNNTDDGANTAIRNEIVESAIRAATRVMSQITPADYFSKYERWEVPGNDEEQVGQKNYVRNQLVRAIRAELATNFQIARCEVNPRRVDSRVATIIKLIQEIGDIEVEVDADPQDSSGPHEAAKVKLVYYVGSVAPDEWANVIQRGEKAFSKSSLTKDLEDWSREALADRTLNEIYGLALQRADNVVVRQQIESFVTQRFIYHYGASVGIKSIKSTYNKADQLAREIAALEVERKTKLLDKYKSYLNEIGKEEDEKLRRDYLRRRRGALQALIVGNTRKSDMDHDLLRQHELELAKVQSELNAANAETLPAPFLRLGPGENSGNPKTGESRPDEPNDADDEAAKQPQRPPRDTSL